MVGRVSTSQHLLSVTFHGAAQSVSGSMHLIEAAGMRLLLDCGLLLGRHPDSCQRNHDFPCDPRTLDAVVISHAHIDHCGNLPNLVRHGFRGPILCTPATRDLMALMLTDSARIHEEDAWFRQLAALPDENSAGLLYGRREVDQTLVLCETVRYRQAHVLHPGLTLTFRDAGHLLGSAMIHLTCDGPRGSASLLYTGDIGRHDLRFLRPPEPLPPVDLVLCESTYGGRRHPPVDMLKATLRRVVRDTIQRGGKVLVPAFSLGRAQLVVYYLREWMREGVLPAVPIVVDSALAADIAEVHSRHPQDMAVFPDAAGRHAPRYVRSSRESRALSQEKGPRIIVASGGMCEAGRILNHFEHSLDDPRNCVVLVSYQAPGSLGRQLLERAPTVRFRGQRWNKWANVVDLGGFSAHADHDGLLDALRPLLERDPTICLVHGDIENATALCRGLEDEGFWNVLIPRRQESVGVNPR